MILLDTDILSLLLAGNPTVVARLSRADDDVAITVITKVQILRGRHDYLLKASDGAQLQRAQFWLEKTEIEVQSSGCRPRRCDRGRRVRQTPATQSVEKNWVGPTCLSPLSPLLVTPRSPRAQP